MARFAMLRAQLRSVKRPCEIAVKKPPTFARLETPHSNEGSATKVPLLR